MIIVELLTKKDIMVDKIKNRMWNNGKTITKGNGSQKISYQSEVIVESKFYRENLDIKRDRI